MYQNIKEQWKNNKEFDYLRYVKNVNNWKNPNRKEKTICEAQLTEGSDAKI